MPDEVIKALSLWQPWASAIACGAKRIETRSWKTKYRGTLLIHAGKREPNSSECRLLADEPTQVFWELAAKAGYRGRLMSWIDGLPYGALIAVAELESCMDILCDGMTTYLAPKTNPYNNTGWEMQTRNVSDDELALGDYFPGNYGWVLRNVRALPEPIPWRGRQGLFNVPEAVVSAQLAAISGEGAS